MSTPSERIFTQLEHGDGAELRDFLPPQARRPMTLARTADRIVGGTALREAVADFVDDLRWVRDESDVAQRITERPRDIEPRADAYLGALAEHVSAPPDTHHGAGPARHTTTTAGHEPTGHHATSPLGAPAECSSFSVPGC